jgi:hypothetical protein
MLNASTEYTCFINFDRYLPDVPSWQEKLHEIGLEREAYNIAETPTGKVALKFWEPDRPEALRVLAKIDAMLNSPAV